MSRVTSPPQTLRPDLTQSEEPGPPVPPPGPLLAAQQALAAKLLGVRLTDRFWGWVAPLVVTAIGGFLRFWHLERPPGLVFDETYYVKEAKSLLDVGYELVNDPDIKEPDKLWNTGNTDVFGTAADFVVHPPLGKWMIAFGEWIFGADDPFGWRFSVALCGTLSILMLARIARRLFRSTLLGTTAGLLLALDGQHFVHSRTGILDLFVMFWALAAFGCLLVDRDVARARLADRVSGGASLLLFGPGLGIRWWRIAAGVSLGLCTGVKWSGLYFLAVFGLLTVAWDLSARRAVGVRHWLTGTFLRDGLTGVLAMVPAFFAAYLATWTGWFLSTDAYFRQWGAEHPSKVAGWVPDALRGLWHYHAEAYTFHVGLTSPHPYESNPWSWLILARPVDYWYEDKTCAGKECAQTVLALGNPVIWWGATIAVAVLVVRWALGRDWRAGAILAGFVAGYLPWFQYQQRTIFSFYAVAFVPFVVLALTYVLGLMLGPPDAAPRRRLAGTLAAGSVVVLAALAFAWFYPIYAAPIIPKNDWQDRMWLPSWI
ncbi:MAG: phospholipid carrier-dependent glycosyltransferase [Actinobacteria bacterium]|nr:phospholipid carrier-dependent glycosyltransferase [Actinomycetota bacterium]